MRRKGVLRAAAGALLVAALAGAAVAQSVFYRLGPAQPPRPDGPRWEYLVVASRPEFDLAVREVTMQPLAAGMPELPFVYEARLLEGRLNHLGEAGWELVAVVGTVGGDQMYVFKRPRR